MDKYQQAGYDWVECMMRIGRKEAAFFENDNILYTESLIQTNCRRMLMAWVYSTMKGAKKIIPLEALQKEEKQEIWDFILDITNGKKRDKKVMLELAKTFYVLEYFLNEKAPE